MLELSILFAFIILMFVVQYRYKLGVFESDSRVEFTPDILSPVELSPTKNLMLSQLQLARVADGLGGLLVESRLQVSACLRAKEFYELASSTEPPYSHEGLQEHIYKLTQSGFTNVAEILAYGYSSPKETVLAWLNSPDHSRFLLRKHYKYVGIGVYISDSGQRYWSVLLGK